MEVAVHGTEAAEDEEKRHGIICQIVIRQESAIRGKQKGHMVVDDTVLHAHPSGIQTVQDLVGPLCFTHAAILTQTPFLLNCSAHLQLNRLQNQHHPVQR